MDKKLTKIAKSSINMVVDYGVSVIEQLKTKIKTLEKENKELREFIENIEDMDTGELVYDLQSKARDILNKYKKEN